jgi:hypothetical protein
LAQTFCHTIIWSCTWSLRKSNQKALVISLHKHRMQNKKWEEKWTWNSRGDGVHEIREHNISHQTNRKINIKNKFVWQRPMKLGTD